ncbi:DNA adenine methylase [Rhizobium sp. RU20A]|uniref:DNA adenine methylase n=1 Tax=Rhizobium sp. RU20A TaxID=1907412 RepID=UPI0009568A34|nr:DNA adenine methylase [Rhizobium sp. RU20A]SIQ18977.1 DNA adenine methylase [Rhizobium sp. RU20A]
MHQEKIKPLRWAGSKSNVAQQITGFLDFSRQYVEPFCGSAAFFFDKKPKKAVLNDLNHPLICCYEDLRKNPIRLWEIYNEIEIDPQSYYNVREMFNDIPPSVERSAYFLYLNHYCFNGIYRTNLKGRFNTPFGASNKAKAKLSLSDVVEFSNVLESCEFYNLDFEQFLSEINPEGACIYMDPPYFTSEARVFGEYGEKIFGIRDLIRLRDAADRLSKNNIVAVSYRDCGEFRELFGHMHISEITVTRNVGGFSGRRKREVELLARAGE